jgi:hypothetical protein
MIGFCTPIVAPTLAGTAGDVAALQRSKARWLGYFTYLAANPLSTRSEYLAMFNQFKGKGRFAAYALAATTVLSALPGCTGEGVITPDSPFVSSETLYFSGLTEAGGRGLYAVEPDGSTRFVRGGEYAYLRGVSSGLAFAAQVNQTAGTTDYLVLNRDGSVQNTLATASVTSLQQVLNNDVTTAFSFYGSAVPEGVQVTDLIFDNDYQLPADDIAFRTLDWSASRGLLLHGIVGETIALYTQPSTQGSQPNILIEDAFDITSASFADDSGNRVVFLESAGTSTSVKLLNAATGAVQTLGTGEFRSAYSPRMSRDGRYVYFTARGEGSLDNRLIRLTVATGEFTEINIPGLHFIETLGYMRDGV